MMTRIRIYCEDCDWCSQCKVTPNQLRSYVFAYHIIPDVGRERDIPGHFCSIDCMRSYHDWGR